MSLIISLTSSNPTESLTKFSVIPKSFFSFLDNLWCVVVSGWVINVFESPKLFEISIRFNLFKNLKEVFFVNFFGYVNSKLNIVPPPFICFFAKEN